jgi:hypothetical protein
LRIRKTLIGVAHKSGVFFMGFYGLRLSFSLTGAVLLGLTGNPCQLLQELVERNSDKPLIACFNRIAFSGKTQQFLGIVYLCRIAR